jgi:hypothetical protein
MMMLEFNPHHDAAGRFTTASSATFTTIRTKSGQDVRRYARPKKSKIPTGAAELQDAGVEIGTSHEAFDTACEKVLGRRLTLDDIHALSGVKHFQAARDSALKKMNEGQREFYSEQVPHHYVSVGLTGSVIARFDYVTPGQGDYEQRTLAQVNRHFKRDAKGKLVATHSYFEMHESMQGSGVGTKVLHDQLSLYRDLGGAEVHLQAALSMGPYVWARMGFKMSNETERRERVIGFRYYLQRYHNVDVPTASAFASRVAYKPWEMAAATLPNGTRVGKEYFKQMANEGSGYEASLTVPPHGESGDEGFQVAKRVLGLK